MTDLEINKILTLLACKCWHEIEAQADEAYLVCVHCGMACSNNPCVTILDNTLYTESLDPTLDLAEKLGYLVDIQSMPLGAPWGRFIYVDLARMEGGEYIPSVDREVKDNRQQALRLDLCEAILLAEGKWEE